MGMTIALVIIAAVLIAAFASMLRSWRRRTRAQAGFVLAAPPAARDAAALATASGLHVATTFAGRPLDRVVAGGLGFRARAHLTVLASGVQLDLVGAAPVWIAAARLESAGAASWALDRGVERDGLTVIAWTIDTADGVAAVESAFRFEPQEAAAIVAAIRSIVEAAHAAS